MDRTGGNPGGRRRAGGAMKQDAWKYWVRMAEREVARTLAGLPQRLRRAAEALPVTCERRPSRALTEDGVEPDTMGLFVGPAFEEEPQAGNDVPSQILLFLEVIREESGDDEEVFREEVRKTYLHELGHYLGLDEKGLEDRELG